MRSGNKPGDWLVLTKTMRLLTRQCFTRRKIIQALQVVGVTSGSGMILLIFLMPFGYAIMTSLKTETQIAQGGGKLWPSSQQMYRYQEKDVPIFVVPTSQGMKHLALVKPGRANAAFVDPSDPATLMQWEGKWRTLEPVWRAEVHWENYAETWRRINFPLLLKNTLTYAFLSTFGAVLSAALVAYGFARFPLPYKNILFLCVLSTILLPPAVTLIPRYVFFHKIGWVGTWLPMIVPAFFANGYNVFLLRQFFLGIPRELDEAAKIDGAGPLRIFVFILLPQAIPALVAVSLFHLFYCWNDFLEPLIFLAGQSARYPITIGLTQFNKLFSQQVNLIQAGAIVSLAIPLAIFFLAQRFFMQGVVVTGVDK